MTAAPPAPTATLPGGRCTRSHILAVARRELGVREQPPGSNRVLYTAWYRLLGPWCAMFISWLADRAGATAIIPRHAYTPSGARWFQDQARWGRTPRVGAIVYYQFPSMGRISHVGIVEAIHSDGTWTAIEGNTDAAGGRTGGQVMRRRRSRAMLGRLGGFGYPRYLPDPLIVDGDLGPVTIRTLQRALGVPADGELGPVTYGALAVRLGLAKTAKRKAVVKAMQRALRVADDGDWGPVTTKALQRGLNARTFPQAR